MNLLVAKINAGKGLTPTSNLLPQIGQCGSLNNDDKQLDRTAANLGDFPWLALLGYKQHDEAQIRFRCGGSLINKRYILTAAQCVSNLAKRNVGDLVAVRLSEHDTSKDIDCAARSSMCSPLPHDFRIEQIIIHPEFDNDEAGSQNDIALIRLNNDVEFSDYVNPICLPKKGTELFSEQLWESGWGGTRNVTKMKSKVPLKPMTECKQAYANLKQVITLNGNLQICARGDGGSCAGDAGGPLMSLYTDYESGVKAWFNVGLLSYGPYPCNIVGIPTIYTKTDAYTDWIVAILRP